MLKRIADAIAGAVKNFFVFLLKDKENYCIQYIYMCVYFKWHYYKETFKQPVAVGSV